MNIFNDMFFNNDMITNNNNIYNPYEAYMKGNLFQNLYNEYKDYNPAKLIPNNEQAELLLNLNQICFENQDIRLYLDVYPTDTNMINRFNENNKKIGELTRIYENKYGPLLNTSLSNTEMFSWEKYNFPWEEVNSR